MFSSLALSPALVTGDFQPQKVESTFLSVTVLVFLAKFLL
jgi:hypothetical protein